MSTLDRIKSVCVELLKVEAGRVQENSRFVEDLGADSMQSIELVAAFEEEFDIEMDEDASLGVKAVSDAVSFIDEVIAQG